MNIYELAAEARRINASKGFWPTFQLEDVPVLVALIHSEVSESWDEVALPKQQWELGDVIIRALDGALLVDGAYLAQIGQRELTTKTVDFVGKWPALRDTAMNHLHSYVTAVLQHYRKTPDDELAKKQVVDDLLAVIEYATALLLSLGEADPVSLVQRIFAANEQREFKHGGRRI